MGRMTAVRAVAFLAVLLLASVPVGRAAHCEQTSVGLTPIMDLGSGLYLGQFQGGLYPNGSNAMPAGHVTEGLARARAVEALDLEGNPSPQGKYVLLSIGMSNTTQEFCSAGSSPRARGIRPRMRTTTGFGTRCCIRKG